jgi:hypothetical protein
MDSNDTGDILLMLLDDDLFWPEDNGPCGDTTITTPPDYTSEIALSER